MRSKSFDHRFWIWAFIAGLFVSGFSLAPQFHLWKDKPDGWNGVYAINDFDEVAYAAYVQSLIDGKGRLNSPYSGGESTAATPQKESLFSIQFLAFYPVAVPARVLGLSSTTAMILVSGIMGFLAGFALFWLFNLVFENAPSSFVGTILVFATGALLAGQGSLVDGFSPSSIYYYVAFPFARRAVPLMGMPFLFLFFGSVWRYLNEPDQFRKLIPGVLALFSFLFLVYIYFYLWTFAAAWFGALTVIWIVFQKENRKQNILDCGVLGLGFLIVLVPYFLALANRSGTMDSVQLMGNSHRPDLFRISVVISIVLLLALAAARTVGRLDIAGRKYRFLLSFVLVAPIVFNQQIITGRSLQPIHYQFYGANYMAAFAVIVLMLTIVRQKLNARSFALVLLFLGSLSIYLAYSETRFANNTLGSINIWRDDLMPAAKKLRELSTSDREVGAVLAFDLAPSPPSAGVVDISSSDELPALSSLPVVWSPHQKVFSDLTSEESIGRLFKFLYYQGLDERWLKDELEKGRSELITGLFGWGRNSNILTEDHLPVSREEIAGMVERYGKFRQSFGPNDAREPVLSYLLVHQAKLADMTAIDKWYERDAGEKAGKYTLYKVRLKDPGLTLTIQSGP